MSGVISINANKEKIEVDVRKANANGLARGGNIAAAATNRFAPVLTTLDAANADRLAANAVLVKARADLDQEGKRNRKALIAVRAAMYTVLGRPATSPEMTRVFPGGVDGYTKVASSHRPTRMLLLASAIRLTKSDKWTPDLCEQWATEVDTLREAFEKVLVDEQAAAMAVQVANYNHGSAVRIAHGKLRTFKRDLLSMEMTNAQAHEIIPSAAPSGAGKKPTDTGTTPGSGAPAPDAGSKPPANNNNSGGGSGSATG